MKRALALVFPPLLLGGMLTVPVPSLSGCSLLAWATDTEFLGRDGTAGRDGRPGQDGRDGLTTSVSADGNPVSLMLLGEEGSPGEDGENGGRPYCHRQPSDAAYDLQAAQGGDGGRGGRGGHGGQGGDVTVYYQDRSHLQHLLVVAAGGRGGRGGRGGQGSLGCRCRVRQWEQTTCTGTPGQADYRCQTSRYFCHDGRDGTSGYPGPDGRPGQDGQLWLVNQAGPLLPDNPSQTTDLNTFATQPLDLSRHLWVSRSGAMALLARGSRVMDRYQDYAGQVEGTVQLDWQANRPLASVATESVTASIQPDGTLAATFAEDLWVDYSTQHQDNVMTLTIHRAVRRQDVTRLAWGGLRDSGPDLRAIILDLGGEAASVDTQFHMALRTTPDNPRDSRRPRYTTAYEGVLPPEVVSLNHNRFELALGHLPLNERSRRPGTYARLEITARRSLGRHTAEQVITWQGQL